MVFIRSNNEAIDPVPFVASAKLDAIERHLAVTVFAPKIKIVFIWPPSHFISAMNMDTDKHRSLDGSMHLSKSIKA